MNHKFKLGDRVSEDINLKDFILDSGFVQNTGEIISLVTGTDEVVVRWDKKSWQDQSKISQITTNILILESELGNKSKTIEEEYAVLEGKIKIKIQRASELINESVDLTAKNGIELRHLYDISRPLMNAIQSAGWNSSSLSC